MTVYLKRRKLLFVTAPKVACSSIKAALFEMDNGFSFQKFRANGKFIHIHHPAIYPAIPFSAIRQDEVANYTRYTMVRDPVKRLLSAYSNRVGHYRELSERHIGDSDLTRDPDLHEFIANFDAYRAASASIRLHTDPLVRFLGEDSGYYHRIFSIHKMNELTEALGHEIPRVQTGGEKIDASELTAAELDFIKSFYAKDYEIYGAYM